MSLEDRIHEALIESRVLSLQLKALRRRLVKFYHETKQYETGDSTTTGRTDTCSLLYWETGVSAATTTSAPAHESGRKTNVAMAGHTQTHHRRTGM